MRGTVGLALVMVAIASAAAAAAPHSSIPTRVQAQAMEPQELARRLLAEEAAEEVTRIHVGGGSRSDYSQTDFWLLGKPRLDDAQFCTRNVYHVVVSHTDWDQLKAEGSPNSVKSTRKLREVKIARPNAEEAAECDGPFVSTVHASEEVLKGILNRLLEARRRAKEADKLPFSLTCSDQEVSERCADGGRTALATLSLDEVISISPVYNTSCVRTVFAHPEGRCPSLPSGARQEIEGWELVIPHAEGTAYTWKIGIAPEHGIQKIELKRGIVIYH